jgi:heme-degrading monooxygenase HmoA
VIAEEHDPSIEVAGVWIAPRAAGIEAPFENGPGNMEGARNDTVTFATVVRADVDKEGSLLHGHRRSGGREPLDPRLRVGEQGLECSPVSSAHTKIIAPSVRRRRSGYLVEGVIHQLRVYEIFDHNKAAFHERFRDHATRIMERHGFRTLAMWETTRDSRTEFVYLLAWPDTETMTEAWRRFMADDEWAEIKRVTQARHGDLVGDIESRVLDEVPYSPGRIG